MLLHSRLTEAEFAFVSTVKNGAADQLTGVDEEGHRLSWLTETIPRMLRMRQIRYGGPPISDDE
jgi:hypothetical protein